MRIHQKRIVNDKIQFQVLLKHYNQSSKKCGLVKWPNFYIGILLPTSLDHWTTVKVVPITTFSFPFHFGVAQCDFSPKHNQVGVEQRGLENKTTDATRMGFVFFSLKGIYYLRELWYFLAITRIRNEEKKNKVPLTDPNNRFRRSARKKEKKNKCNGTDATERQREMSLNNFETIKGWTDTAKNKINKKYGCNSNNKSLFGRIYYR